MQTGNVANRRLRRAVWCLSLLAVLQFGLLLALAPWRTVADAWDGVHDQAFRLFGRSVGGEPSGRLARTPIVAEAPDAEIDDLHARVLRVFEEMAAMSGGPGAAFAPGEDRAARARRDILNWQREIDRIFEQAFHHGAWRRVRQPQGLEWGRASVSPGMRVTEDQDSYHVAVMLPDLENLGVEMRVQEGVLSITASGPQGRYMTRLRLPGAVDADDIQAHCGQDNILRVRVPKAAAAGVAVWRSAI